MWSWTPKILQKIAARTLEPIPRGTLISRLVLELRFRRLERLLALLGGSGDVGPLWRDGLSGHLIVVQAMLGATTMMLRVGTASLWGHAVAVWQNEEKFGQLPWELVRSDALGHLEQRKNLYEYQLLNRERKQSVTLETRKEKIGKQILNRKSEHNLPWNPDRAVQGPPEDPALEWHWRSSTVWMGWTPGPSAWCEGSAWGQKPERAQRCLDISACSRWRWPGKKKWKIKHNEHKHYWINKQKQKKMVIIKDSPEARQSGHE